MRRPDAPCFTGRRITLELCKTSWDAASYAAHVEALQAEAEEGLARFNGSLIPDAGAMLGVRLPALRAAAKQIARGDWRGYLACSGDAYYETTLLAGFVLGYARCPLDERLRALAQFLPRINNWSVCDSTSASLKAVRADRAATWAFLKPNLGGTPFETRFVLVMLLDHFVDEAWLPVVFWALDHAQGGYYVDMAAAWAVSVLMVRFPEQTRAYLERCTLSDWTYNKALQKCIESRRFTPEQKDWFRQAKRRERNEKRLAKYQKV